MHFFEGYNFELLFNPVQATRIEVACILLITTF